MKIFTLTIFIVGLSLLSLGQNPVFNWEKTELSENNLKVMSINGDNAVIAGYDNGFFKSTNGGTSWDTLDLFNPAFTLIDLSIKGDVGYIVAQREKLYDAGVDVYINGFIMKTTDGGTTWNILDDAKLGFVDDPSVSPSDTLCYGIDFQSVETYNDSIAFCSLRWYVYSSSGPETHNGIFKTTDGGLNWKNVSGDMGNNITTVIGFNGDKGYAGGNKHLYEVSAMADTLKDVFGLLPGDGSDYISDITFVNENEMFVVTTGDGIYHSMDGGSSFEKLSGINGGWDILKVNDSTLVVGYSSNKSYVSTDMGATWKQLGISTSIWEIPAIVNDSVYMLANSKILKIAVTDLLEGNYNITEQVVGTNNLQKAYVANATDLIVVGNDDNFYKTNDGGISWTFAELPEYAALQKFYEDVDFDGLSMVGDKGYASFNRIKFVDYKDQEDIYWSGGIVYTENNWETWKFIDVAKIGAANSGDISLNPNHADCGAVNTGLLQYIDNDVLLAYCKWYDYTSAKTEHGRIFKTLDGGKNWTAITEDLSNHYVNDIEVEGDTMYLGGSKMLLKTTGASLQSGTSIIDFTDLYPVLDEGEDDAMYINSVWADSDELFVLTSVDSCYMSTDGGASFVTLGNTKGSNDCYRFDSNSFIMLGSDGKSKFTNNMTDWIDCHPGAVIYTIGGIYNGKLYGLARGDVYSTSVEDLDIKTSAPITVTREGLNVYYETDAVQIASDNHEIERCVVYSITGKTVSIQEPNNRICRLNRGNYQPGIYIANCVVQGKTFSNKIIFK